MGILYKRDTMMRWQRRRRIFYCYYYYYFFSLYNRLYSYAAELQHRIRQNSFRGAREYRNETDARGLRIGRIQILTTFSDFPSLPPPTPHVKTRLLTVDRRTVDTYVQLFILLKDMCVYTTSSDIIIRRRRRRRH